ncbi:hypothetical protein Tco_0109368 [Tanacetum coccineum]
MFDEYFNPPPSVVSPVPAAAAPRPADPTGTPSSTIIDQDAPSPSTSQTPQETQSPVIPSGVEEHFYDIEVSHLDYDPFFGVLISKSNYEESSSGIRDYSMGHGSAHGSAPINDDEEDSSPVEEVSPVKPKKPLRRAVRAKNDDPKEPPKD